MCSHAFDKFPDKIGAQAPASRLRRLGFTLFLLCLLPVMGSGAEPVSFRKDIAPILLNKCQTCHGPEKAKGKYQLQTFELLSKAGSSKDAPIVAGKPEQSELFRLIASKDEDERMPQNDKPLPPDQIALIERWIREGGKFDGEDAKASLVSLIPRAEHPAPPEAYPQTVPAIALAFSPDGKELAVGGYHEIAVWQPETGKLLRRIRNVAKQTHALSWHRDGTWLAAASADPGKLGEVALFDAKSGERIKVLTTLPDAALEVEFSPDGTRLAEAGADNIIRIFEIPSGKELLKIEQHADWVMALSWKPDGTEIASASRDKTARVFKLPSGELDSTFTDHGDPVLAIAFSADGKTVFSGGRDRRVFSWDAAEAKRGRQYDGFGQQIHSLLVSGNFLFSTAADKLVRQHKLDDRSLVRTFEGHRDWVYGLALHAESKRLATGGYDGEIRVWNLEDGKLVKAFTAAPGFLSAKRGE